MGYEHINGSFSLFKNDKGGNDKRPDYRGEGKDLAGNPIEVAAWMRRGTQGTEFLSCTIKAKSVAAKQDTPPISKPEPQSAGKRAGSAFDDMDDDVPL